IAVVLAAGAIAVAARGSSGSTPPPKPLAQAIHDALGAAEPDGVTARISFTNKLFPSGALTGQAGSALMTGATGRLWANANGGRLGRAELAWDATHGTPLKVAVYAQGSSSPALALQATDISFGPVPESDIAVSPPAGAKIVDLSSQTGSGTSGSGTTAPVTGL